MIIQSFVFNAFYENTYLLSDSEGNTLVVDPGCYEPYEERELTEYIAQNKLTVKAVINTHCHIDHVLGNSFVKRKYGVQLWAPIGEKKILSSVGEYSLTFGIERYDPAEVDLWLDTSSIQVGNLNFEIRLVPGHAPGHIVLYHKETKSVIGGDALFKESIGRTDLPYGNHELLLTSIREQLFSLPDDTIVYPGHGPSTTIAHEKQFNPFLR